MESENTVGTETTMTTKEETEEKPGIERLADLLGETDDDGMSDDVEPEPEEQLTKFNDLAERLGMKLDDLYKLEVSQASDGKSVTVEDLKDRYIKQEDIELREFDFEERRTQQESQLMQAQEELRELMAALPEKSVKPEVLQRARDKYAARVQMERNRTLEVIPAWQDEKVREADIKGMTEHLQQYGYPVGHLERVADHRQMKYIRDNYQREQRIRKALEQVKAGKPNPTTRQKPASKAAQKQPLAGVRKGQARNKLEAVFSQLDKG